MSGWDYRSSSTETSMTDESTAVASAGVTGTAAPIPLQDDNNANDEEIITTKQTGSKIVVTLPSGNDDEGEYEEDEEESFGKIGNSSTQQQTRLSGLARSSAHVADAASASADEDEEEHAVIVNTAAAAAVSEFKPVYGDGDFENEKSEEDEDDEEIEVKVLPKILPTKQIASDDKIENWGAAPTSIETKTTTKETIAIAAEADFSDNEEDGLSALKSFAAKPSPSQKQQSTMETKKTNAIAAAAESPTSAFSDLLQSNAPASTTTTAASSMEWSNADFFALHSDRSKLMSTVASELHKSGEPIENAILLSRAVFTAIHDLCVTSEAQNIDNYKQVLNTISTAARRHTTSVQDTLKQHITSLPSALLGAELASALKTNNKIPFIDAHAAVSSGRFTENQALKALMSVAYVSAIVLASSDAPEDHSAWLTNMTRSSLACCDALNTYTTNFAHEKQRRVEAKVNASTASTVASDDNTRRMSRLERTAAALQAHLNL